MHTTKVNKTTFIHHGGYTGEVIIRSGEREVVVPIKDLLEFVGEIVKDRLIGSLEQMDGDKLLNLIVKGRKK